MTEQDVELFLKRWWDGVWHAGDIDLVDDLFTDPFTHHSARGNVALSRREFKQRLVQYQRVLHGPVTSIDDFAISGDTLWLRATSRGVNLETNGPSLVTWVNVYRFDAGRVTETWVATVPDVDWTR